MSGVSHTLILRGIDAASIREACVDLLTADGWTCLPPGHPRAPMLPVEGKWETPGELATRLGLAAGTVTRKMSQPECPRPNAREGGPQRTVKLISSPALDEFLTRHKEGGAEC